MMEVACQCGNLPPHDHRIPNPRYQDMTEEERWRFSHGGEIYEPSYFDPDDIGRIWVDWKGVARALKSEEEGSK